MSAQGIRAGRAFVEIGAVDKFSAVLAQAEAKLKSFAAGIAAVGAKIAAPGLAIAIPFSGAIKTFAAFDDGMRAAGSIAGAVGDELESLTHVAEELGRTTSFTAAQISTLMTEFGRIGFNPSQIKAATAAILNLARATGTDVSNASTIVGTALNQFGLDATKTAMVADMLAKTANVTASSVESIGYGMSYAGVISKQLGTSMEETLAIMGQLANAGIDGTSAGTDLRRIQAIVKSQAAMMKEAFNVDTRDAQGNLKPLIQVLNEIGVATANLDAEAKATKFEEVFGLLGMTSSMVLSSAATNVSKLADEIRNSGGDAKRTAEEMDKGIGGAMRRVESAFEGVQLAIGKSLSSAFSPLADAFARILSDVAKWVEGNQAAVLSVGVFVAGSLALGSALLTVAAALQVVAGAIAGIVLINAVSMMFFQATAAVVFFGAVLRATSYLATNLGLVFRTLATPITAMSSLTKTAAIGLLGLQAKFYGTATGAAVATVSTHAFNGAVAVTPWYTTLASAALLVLKAVYLAFSSPVKLATNSMLLFRDALVLTGRAAKLTWAYVLWPLTVFAAAAGAMVLVTYGIAKAFVAAFQRAKSLSAVFNTLSMNWARGLAVIKATFKGVTSAIKNGNYSAAVAIMWAGIKAGFWAGLKNVLDVIAYFVTYGLDEFIAFGKAMIAVLWDAFKQIPGLLWKALRGGISLAEIIREAFSGNQEAYLNMFRKIEKAHEDSTKELFAMVDAQNAATKSAKVLADQQERLNMAKEELANRKKDAPTAQDKNDEREDLQGDDKKTYEAMEAELAAVLDELRKDGATDEQLKKYQVKPDAATGTTKTEPTSDQLKLEENHVALQERIDALSDEARALEKGEDAAERYKFAQSVNNDAVLMGAYDNALAARTEAQLASDVRDRITALQEEAYELKNGADAAESYRFGLMNATSMQMKALKASLQAAQDAANQARKADQLKQDGASMKDSLRNPLEVFRDEWAKFNELRAAGAIDDETLGRARNKAREDLFGNITTEDDAKDAFDQERSRIAGEVQAGEISPEQAGQQLSIISELIKEALARAADAGNRITKLTSAGTFSGFAVGRMSGQSKTEQLQSRIATATEKNVEETKKTREAIEKQQGMRYGQ